MRAAGTLMFAAAAVFLPVDVAVADTTDRVYIGQGFSAPSGQTDAITSTVIWIRETDYPGADAEVYYQNAAINDSATDDGREYFAEWNGIRIEVIFDHDYQGDSPDLVTVLPPDGYICLPSCEMLVEEYDRDIIYLIPWVISDANDNLVVPLQAGDGARRLVLSSRGVHGLRTEDTLSSHG